MLILMLLLFIDGTTEEKGFFLSIPLENEKERKI